MKPVNVHYVGDGLWGIGIYDPHENLYTQPMTAQESRLTGCHTYFFPSPFGRLTHDQALAAAKDRFGYVKE